MTNGIWTGDPHGFNKGVVRSSVKVPELDKHPKKVGGHIGRDVGGNNNKDEDKCLKTLNDKKP